MGYYEREHDQQITKSDTTYCPDKHADTEIIKMEEYLETTLQVSQAISQIRL